MTVQGLTIEKRSMASGRHVPVMCAEMIEALAPGSGGIYFDGTLGSGGYAEALLEASHPDGRVIGVDVDAGAVERCRERFARYGQRATVIHGGYHQAGQVLAELGIAAVDGAVLDLGLSSDQVQDAERGFSFQQDGPLDMRFDSSQGEPASDYLQHISSNKLEEILATYGEERYCKKLARAIHGEARRGGMKTTRDLVRSVEKLLGSRRGKIHPATRVFQAIRIAVNRELEHVRLGLEVIPRYLTAGARFCVVSYHSLEDREVKKAFRERACDTGRWKVLTAKPLRPSAEEVSRNPRARSARMRVLEALSTAPPGTGRYES